MSATFTWRVTLLGVDSQPVDGHDGMVSVVYWECSGTEDVGGITYSSTLCRNTTVPYDSAHPFIAYADLTEAEALEWVFEQGDVKASTEAEIQGMIDAQATPPIVTPPLPWVVQ